MTQDSNDEDHFFDEGGLLDNLDTSDYVFILNGDGDLKTLLLPEDFRDCAPENVTKILKIFDSNRLQPRTIH